MKCKKFKISKNSAGKVDESRLILYSNIGVIQWEML